ncbi:ABC transporter permease [Acidicapsa ligni]|uniref:ABC transporter permease n=1 Tax=Acidicapsa ligni TaxID=542300 RepID=UPI0021E08351|nr:ABC transporter permease [Acidicapsa ligni]
MTPLPMWRRYARLLGPDPKADVRDELYFHIETKTDDLVAHGWPREHARREAERQFGSLLDIQKIGNRIGEKMERRRQLKDYWIEARQDLRYTLRTLGRDRNFAAVSILILALGIGANIAVFSVVNTLLLRQLPFPQAQQLTWFEGGSGLSPALREAIGLSGTTFTVDAFEDFQRHNQSFQSLTAYNPFLGSSDYALTGRGEPQPVSGVMIAGNFFQTLGVQPVIGRLFSPEETHKGGRPAVLLSNNFWRRQFNSDPAILGQTITLSKQPVTVVGILPASFDFGSVFSPGLRMDVYIPAIMDNMRSWGNTLSIVGRLKPGVSVQQAQAEASLIGRQFEILHPGPATGIDIPTVSSLKDYVSGKLRRSLITLWCAVGLIQLIVCVNLTNLLLARGAVRSKEFALRTALGAGRGRLLRQLLTESLVLASSGAILGVALAFALTSWLAHQASLALPLLSNVRVDGSALLWTLLVTTATALLFGLIPGLRLSSGNPQEALKDGGQGRTTSSKHERLRAVMVISEMALACVLLVCAGLLLRSFVNVMNTDLGFHPERAASINITYEDGNDPARRAVVLSEITRQIGTIPGVDSTGIADMLPLGRNRSWLFFNKARPPLKGDITAAIVRIVSPGYLNAMGMHLREGRDLSWNDGPKTERVVIINQAAARRFFPGEDPVGRLSVVDDNDTRIVGVLNDVRENSVEASVGPEIYLPITQNDPEGAQLVIRTKLPPASLASSVLQTLRTMNPSQPASEFVPLQQAVSHATSPRRFFALLVIGFAALGLLLAALGIYGVISYSVTRQTQEIGIRMALGATIGNVQRSVISKAMRLAAIGIAIGTVASYLAAKGIASLLYGTESTDPAAFAAMIVMLGIVALIAAWIPARRASRIDPMIALRSN